MYMKPDEARELIAGGGIEPPFRIRTVDGRSYQVKTRSNVFLPDAYPDTLVVAVPRKGMHWIGLGSIASIHHEHEAISARD